VSKSTETGVTRRDVIRTAGGVAIVSSLAGLSPYLYAAESGTIQVALIGCGGRGTGAAENALSVKNGPIRLVAMADVFKERLASSYDAISKSFAKQVDVPEERRFVSFDGYKSAIDCLKPGDVAIFATPPAFRWVHFAYAIQKGINVFMEKPVTVDGPSTVKLLKLAEESEKKGLKVGVGLMCRHCKARQELFDRIKSGEIGDIILLRAYRQHGPVGSAFTRANKGPMTELLYQVRNFHSFLWASGGCFSDFYIHNIDECCWMKDAWPVKAAGSGGRHYRGDYVDQNFDSYSVEYTFADGSKLLLEGRTMAGAHTEFASYAHGSKGCAAISVNGHTPAYCRTYKGQVFAARPQIATPNDIWRFPQPEPNPYQLEWDHLIAAIRDNKPYNEARRGAEASLVTSMGRMACHTGQVITYEQMLNCDHEFAPEVDKLTMESAAPLVARPDGKYEVPEPGKKTKREF
jgi:predicted dehydrogenase